MALLRFERSGTATQVYPSRHQTGSEGAGGGGANDEPQGVADDMADGSEVVTRRYEFYRYGADPNTLDGETGEAMCSEVQPTTDPNDPLYRHGVAPRSP